MNDGLETLMFDRQVGNTACTLGSEKAFTEAAMFPYTLCGMMVSHHN